MVKDFLHAARMITAVLGSGAVARPGDRLRQSIESAAPTLERFTDERASQPRQPGKWSRKELLGHLIDSASNNHQRFVRAQLGDDLIFPTYDTDRWVAVQRYRDAPWSSLLILWREFNLQIARVFDAMPEAIRTAPRARHNLDQIAFHPVAQEEPATLQYLMDDYVDHLNHHIAQFEPFPDSEPLNR